MTRTDPAPRTCRPRTAQLIAFLAVLLAGVIAYALTQTGSDTQTQAVAPELVLLQQQPTLGSSGPRYDIVVDFECPYCNQFLSGDAYATILEQAKAGQAQLNVTAAAFLNEKSTIKGAAYNCVAELAGPQAALRILPDLKTPGGDTNHWTQHARALGAQHADEVALQTCIDAGAAQERANTAFKTTGVRGVPAVFIDGTETPWPEVRPN